MTTFLFVLAMKNRCLNIWISAFPQIGTPSNKHPSYQPKFERGSSPRISVPTSSFYGWVLRQQRMYSFGWIQSQANDSRLFQALCIGCCNGMDGREELLIYCPKPNQLCAAGLPWLKWFCDAVFSFLWDFGGTDTYIYYRKKHHTWPPFGKN